MIQLKHLDQSHADAFFQVVDDPDVRKYFSAFNAKKEEITAGMDLLSTNPISKQYWGIFLEDGTLVGFVALQKNHGIWTILKKMQDTEAGINEADNLDSLDETEPQRKRRMDCEQYQSPYALDVVIHPQYRGRGIAKETIAEVTAYALKAGIAELYLEVHQENTVSLQLIKSLNAELITKTDNLLYPSELYRLSPSAEPQTPEQIKQAMRELPTQAEKTAYHRWAELSGLFPELWAHKELLNALFLAILRKKARIEWLSDIDSCRCREIIFEKFVYIGTKKRQDPLSLIWSIAHEYGHLCQAPPTDLEKKYCTREKYLREVDAWNIAETWLQDQPFYQHHWPDFIRFRNSRLESYLPASFQETQ